ncbi:hypothetical protein HIM_02196 [Hirsutella minnesotensis 3608]|nr:hypothetical protein HIM_02196 [Hirsutella minnesotensis 3608]
MNAQQLLYALLSVLLTLAARRTFVAPPVEETLNHPAYPGAIWALKPHEQGKATVAKGRGRPVDIAWEIHGTGPIKVVLIMGLAAVMSAWQPQTLYFGHDRADRYSVLVFDNRGMGRSDKPLMRYTTSEMARDVVELLDHVGWTAPRQLNVVGISLGGMIAQELACLAPARVQSLSLLCTSALLRDGNASPANIAKRLALLKASALEQAVEDTAHRIFVPEWLAAPDEAVLPEAGVTPMCGPPSDADGGGGGGEYRRFDSNFQRFQAQELVKRRDGHSFTVRGYLCQILAAGGHRKSDAQLLNMADAVGRDRILVMHGTRDVIIDVKNAHKLISVLKPAHAVIEEGMGHAPIMERSSWFNKLMEERFEAWYNLSDTAVGL